MAVDTGTLLVAERDDAIAFKDPPALHQYTIDKITKKLVQIRKDLCLSMGVEISLYKTSPPHIGLGSGTALTLASIEALLLINEYEYSTSYLQFLSDRGGTSGVGIHSYFTGGFVFDAGVKTENRPHQPSSSIKPNSLPLLLFRKDYPFGSIRFLYPNGMYKNHGADEEKFFNITTPIREFESFEACYNSIFMVAASLSERDLESFIRSIDEIKKTKWKESEIKNGGEEVKDIFDSLQEAGISGAGMSSMGPGIFIVSSVAQKVIDKIKERYNLNEIILIPNNSGRALDYA